MFSHLYSQSHVLSSILCLMLSLSLKQNNAKYRDLSVFRRSIICRSLDLLVVEKLRYFSPSRPIIDNYLRPTLIEQVWTAGWSLHMPCNELPGEHNPRIESCVLGTSYANSLTGSFIKITSASQHCTLQRLHEVWFGTSCKLYFSVTTAWLLSYCFTPCGLSPFAVVYLVEYISTVLGRWRESRG